MTDVIIIVVAFYILFFTSLGVAQSKPYTLTEDKKGLVVNHLVTLEAKELENRIKDMEDWIDTIDVDIARMKVERKKQIETWKKALKEMKK